MIFADIVLEFPDLFTKKFQDSIYFNFKEGLPDLKIDETLLAATCVILASKFYEIDDNLIMICDLQKELKSQNKFKLVYQDVQRTEIELLNKLEWNLLRASPIDFVHAFIQIGVVQSNDILDGISIDKVSDIDIRKSVTKVENLSLKICDEVIKGNLYRNKKP